ncbi:hypothetical protein BS47DRAFT_1369699 [Hydnum rufescens UP504]|uniref:Uncharacterized protein n=1 Tax=Hydnum rufescens UP504 TaxID=1448309 RepID=A0A9P6AC27_9AGAM|nr:hypothetical protein BS47DRAFT_1369699 [Hydnum rufescens UP504]
MNHTPAVAGVVVLYKGSLFKVPIAPPIPLPQTRIHERRPANDLVLNKTPHMMKTNEAMKQCNAENPHKPHPLRCSSDPMACTYPHQSLPRSQNLHEHEPPSANPPTKNLRPAE